MRKPWAARGIVVSYESIREWGLRFGRQFANELKRRRPRPGDKWHLDEVFIRLGGKQHYLWRAVDQDGHVLDILVQSRRNTTSTQQLCHEPPLSSMRELSQGSYSGRSAKARWDRLRVKALNRGQEA